MSLIAQLATPETLHWLLMAKTISFAISLIGVLAIATWVSVLTSPGRSPGGNGTLIFGGIVFAIGIILTLSANYGIDYVNANRPFEITHAHGFVESKYQPIASLKDNAVTNGITGRGSFFLGCGAISISGGNTIPVYVFYKRTPDNEFIQDTLPSANVYIKEDGGNDPKIEWIYNHYVTEKKVYTDNGETIGGADTVTLTKTRIHVPKDTIKVDYKLDSSYTGGAP